jgi:hypothetical protein
MAERSGETPLELAAEDGRATQPAHGHLAFFLVWVPGQLSFHPSVELPFLTFGDVASAVTNRVTFQVDMRAPRRAALRFRGH